MSSPVLLAVDEDERSLHDIERELRDRYERRYRIVCVGSAPEGEAELARMADADEEAALVLAGSRSAANRGASSWAGCEGGTPTRSVGC